MSERNPGHDPRQGDVLRLGLYPARTVTRVDGNNVYWRTPGGEGMATRANWQSWASQATVLELAE